MDSRETIFFWAAMAVYLVSALLLIAGFAFKTKSPERVAGLLLWVGFSCHALAILFRWIATGHPPVMKNYENALTGAWAVILVLLLIRRSADRIGNHISLVLIPFAMLMMGYGVMNAPALEPYRPVFRTPWLVVHIVFAWFAYSSFTGAFGAGVVYLIRERRLRKSAAPSAENTNLQSLDELGGNLIVFGFISSTVMILAGSIWASKLWGSYWGWDPIETWSLISWMVYGVYLHLRFAFKWKGAIMAWLAVVALITVIIAFWGVNFVMASLHDFQTM